MDNGNANEWDPIKRMFSSFWGGMSSCSLHFWGGISSCSLHTIILLFQVGVEPSRAIIVSVSGGD